MNNTETTPTPIAPRALSFADFDLKPAGTLKKGDRMIHPNVAYGRYFRPNTAEAWTVTVDSVRRCFDNSDQDNLVEIEYTESTGSGGWIVSLGADVDMVVLKD